MEWGIKILCRWWEKSLEVEIFGLPVELDNFSSIPWKLAAYQLACYCLQRIGPSSKAGSALLIFCRNSRQSIMDNWQLAGQILTWRHYKVQDPVTALIGDPGHLDSTKMILSPRSSLCLRLRSARVSPAHSWRDWRTLRPGSQLIAH